MGISQNNRAHFLFGLLINVLCFTNTNSFITTDDRRFGRNISNSKPMQTSLSMAFQLQDISDFYVSYPLESAIATCGIKGSLADITAQVRSWRSNKKGSNRIEFSRNMVQVIYGGLIGVMCHLLYDNFFPAFFGTSKSFDTVFAEVLFDVFLVGPLIWLPPAYLIKALVLKDTLTEGVQNYVDDIRNEGLLLKYWTVWVPAEACTFGLIPDHLRVAFFASVSFFWFIILSTVSFKDPEEEAEAVAPLVEIKADRTTKTK